MWGAGGRFYWSGAGAGAGIAVLFAWPSSEDRDIEPYARLYDSLGWRSLVCHSNFVALSFPDKATSLADAVLKELVQVLKIRPLPVVFTAFSGGTIGCMYKALQLIDGKYGAQLRPDECQLLKDCMCGQIYDSSPVDFKSSLGSLHQSSSKTSWPPRVFSWMAKAVASGMESLFTSRFEAQNADYWGTLYASVNLGPFLVFSSEDDEVAPFPVVYNFVQHLVELGGDVKLIKWNKSPHLGHYEHHKEEYKASVSELLNKAATVYSARRQEGTHISVYNLHKAALSSNESLRRVTTDPSDHFTFPSSLEYRESKDGCSSPDNQKEETFRMHDIPSINADGALGQILFDVCVPKNIEGWDIKPSMSSRRHYLSSPPKRIRRSRL